MRVALTTIHASALALTLGCSCAQAAPPEQRERESLRSAQPPAAPVQRELRVERGSQGSPAAARIDSRQFEPRQSDPRADSRVDELRRQEPGSHQNSDAFRRNGRLTADERRDLRRQINEAGQDIYPNTPRR